MRLSLFVYLIAQVVAVGMAESQPKAEEVLKSMLRQPLESTNPAVQSFEAEVEVGSMKTRYCIWYSTPQRATLKIIDANDGTPLVVAAEGMVAFYDSYASCVVLFTNRWPELKLICKSLKESGKSSVNFGCGFASHPSKAGGELQFPDWSKIKLKNFQTDLRSASSGKYEIRASCQKIDNETGKKTELIFTGVTDWPAREIPFRSAEFCVPGAINVKVRSVNEPIPEFRFRFPLQALLTSGLPVRRVSADDKNADRELANLTTLVYLRQLLLVGNSQEAKAKTRNFLKSLAGSDPGKWADQIYRDRLKSIGDFTGNPEALEKMLSQLPPEQWEQIRVQFYSDLAPEEFTRQRQSYSFRKELIEKVRSWSAQFNKDYDKVIKEGIDLNIYALTDAATKLDSLDIEALRAKDQKIASQLRQAFQLETVSSK